jgi:hypothetical protein
LSKTKGAVMNRLMRVSLFALILNAVLSFGALADVLINPTGPTNPSPGLPCTEPVEAL